MDKKVNERLANNYKCIRMLENNPIYLMRESMNEDSK